MVHYHVSCYSIFNTHCICTSKKFGTLYRMVESGLIFSNGHHVYMYMLRMRMRVNAEYLPLKIG